MKFFTIRNLKLRNFVGIMAFFFIILMMSLSDIIYFYNMKDYGLVFLIPLRLFLLFMIPLPLLRNHIKLYAILPAILAIFGLFACFPVIYFKTRVGESIITLIWHTNYGEATELVKGYLLYIFILVAVLTVILIYLIKKLPKAISLKQALILSLISLTYLISVPFISKGGENYIYNLSHSIGKYYPFYIANNFRKFLGYNKFVTNYSSNVKDFKFNAVKKDTLNRRQVYILIIGESSRYDHWGINGYQRNTSPKLDSQKNLLSFTDVCAPGAYTEMSVPLIITRATPGNYLKHVYEKSIVSLFKEAGFDTYWITDQDDNGNIYIHEKEADTIISLITPYNAIKNQYRDMDLIEVLKQVLIENQNNLFIVLHTLGSHWDYRVRYPDQYEVFKPTGKNEFLNYWLVNKAKFTNAYDNTIRYTDAVIDSVIHLSNRYSKISSVVYISDHGENLFDDDRNFIFHAADNISEYTAHIPLFIYTNPLYDSIYPSKVAALKSHINYKISGSNIFWTLADMANIYYSGEDLTKSIASKKFIESKQMVCITPDNCISYSSLK